MLSSFSLLCYILCASTVELYGDNSSTKLFYWLELNTVFICPSPPKCTMPGSAFGIAPADAATWDCRDTKRDLSSNQLLPHSEGDPIIMARRPSTVSLSSVGSGSGLSKLAQLPPLPGLPSRGSKALSNGSPPVSRKASLNTPQVNVTKNGDAWDPDDLFTKHTVAEVKAIQQRLRLVLVEYSA